MNRSYETLDAVVVIASLVMVTALGAALVLVKIPSEQLPIVASLVTAILSLPVAYGAFRWGNNVGSKNAAEAAAETTKAANAALAQIAGATATTGATTDLNVQAEIVNVEQKP